MRVLFFFLLHVVDATAQTPSESWEVVETEHFRLHTPVSLRDWTLLTAARLEGIRTVVSDEVGYAPPQKVQVVVSDPYATANGMAYPMGRSPRVILWAHPPGSDSPIGHNTDWGTDLALHEEVHIVHLLMPPRALSGQLMLEIFKVGPMLMKSPRWLIEGYATLVEGKVTGSGRPHGHYRATVLRELAQAGRLPRYGELSGGKGWLGMSHAYLVGSAYLEWLEARQGEGSLRALWKRMTARHSRSFEQAFRGVFGSSPVVLYYRFCAELTADAMEGEQSSEGLWLKTSGPLGRPTLSPDGARIAFVRGRSKGPPILEVWQTAVDEAGVVRRAQKIEEILERDPQDVGPVESAHPPHRLQASYANRTRPPANPTWLNEDTLIYDAPVADASGRLRRELFRWTLGAAPRRLTYGGDVSDSDAGPGGILAVRTRGGATAIVRLDAQTGEEEVLVGPDLQRVVDQPVWAPDGERFAYLAHEGGRFVPYVRDQSGEDVRVEVPDDSTILQLAWGPRGLSGAVGLAGRVDLWDLSVHEAPRQRTHSGAAFGPTPGLDFTYFVELGPQGHTVHRYAEDAPMRPTVEADLGLAGLPTAVSPVDLPQQDVSSRRMKLGLLEPSVLVGGSVGFAAQNLELGARLGDVVGRNELVVMGSVGSVVGVTAWWVNRTLPVDLSVRGWAANVRGEPSFGGSVVLHDSFTSSGLYLDGTAGIWSTGAPAGVTAAGFGELGVGLLEPQSRAVWMWADLAGTAGSGGEAFFLWDTTAGISLGRTWSLSAEGGLGAARGVGFVLGGVRSGVLPDYLQWSRIQPGWLAPNSRSGPGYLQATVAFGNQGIEAFWQTYRIGVDPLGSYTLIGLRVKQGTARQPLFRLPGVSIEFGIGCTLAEEAAVDRPCTDLRHYRTWSSVRWTPFR